VGWVEPAGPGKPLATWEIRAFFWKSSPSFSPPGLAETSTIIRWPSCTRFLIRELRAAIARMQDFAEERRAARFRISRTLPGRPETPGATRTRPQFAGPIRSLIFTAEFGFHEERCPSRPAVWACWAGDHLKVRQRFSGWGWWAVSLFYREGYFMQANQPRENWQVDYYRLPPIRANLPMDCRCSIAHGEPLGLPTVDTRFQQPLSFQAWKVKIGAAADVYLIDAKSAGRKRADLSQSHPARFNGGG